MLLVFLVSVVGTAGFGHVLNDLTDLAADARTGKPNTVSRLLKPRRIPVLLALLSASLAPWLYLPVHALNFGLLLALLALFVLYSVPPLRLKERHVWGIFADSLYAHALPVVITGVTFSLFATPLDSWHMALLWVLFAWKLAQGLCGAIASQISDRKNDRRSLTATFVITFGPRPAHHLLIRILQPLQFSLFLALCGLVSVHVPAFGLAYLLFLLVTAREIHWRQKRPLTIYCRTYMGYAYINDFSEQWMALVLLAHPAAGQPWYTILLLLHLAVFKTPLPDLWRRMRKGGRTRRPDRAEAQALGPGRSFPGAAAASPTPARGGSLPRPPA